MRVNLSLEKGFLDTLDEAARVRGMTRSAPLSARQLVLADKRTGWNVPFG